MDELLIWCHRRLGPLARKMGVQKAARRLYEGIAAIRYPDGSLCTAVQNGRTWKLRRDVAERGEFQEFETIAWLREVVRPGATVIDVGANVGQMTLEMAALVGPQGRVISIEPSPGNLEYLRQHVDENGFHDRVVIVDAACSNEDGGEVTFFVASEDGVSSVGSGHNIIGAGPILKHADGINVREQRVPRVSIDGLCRRLGIAPSVIKIDVEGAELLVLEGALNTLGQQRPQVRVGFHPFAFEDAAAASRKAFDLVGRAGYRIEGIDAGQTLDLFDYNLRPPPGQA